jgi:hypothetical protein
MGRPRVMMIAGSVVGILVSTETLAVMVEGAKP